MGCYSYVVKMVVAVGQREGRGGEQRGKKTRRCVGRDAAGRSAERQVDVRMGRYLSGRVWGIRRGEARRDEVRRRLAGDWLISNCARANNCLINTRRTKDKIHAQIPSSNYGDGEYLEPQEEAN